MLHNNCYDIIEKTREFNKSFDILKCKSVHNLFIGYLESQ